MEAVIKDPKGPPLREHVYAYLKCRLNDGRLKPGAALDLKSLSEDLGFSRTPLRDALLRLEAEGFVTIQSRRGVIVTPLDLETIRNSYQIIGALESAAILEAASDGQPGMAMRMLELNERMKASLVRGDFDAYYEDNVAFHDCYISPSRNEELKRTVRILKERLYDFPREGAYVAQWEEESVLEHERLARLLLDGRSAEAAAFARDVHWSFEAQEHFIIAYYFRRGATPED